jgi:hypothetical protein
MKVLDLIGREKMRESKFFDEVIAEGRVEASREAVLAVLKARFGPESVAAVRDLLADVTDDALLLELVERAAACRRFSQFRQQTESLIATAK